ncbi:hypothetical protein LEA_04260, partial [human gut metagenome]
YDNFVYHTLMSMETNTLDKKYNERYGEYHIYSYLSRTPSSGQRSAATRSGVNHGVEKDDPVPSFGIGNYALVSFVDQSGRPTGRDRAHAVEHHPRIAAGQGRIPPRRHHRHD